MARRSCLIVIGALLAFSCDAEMHPPFDLSVTGFRITQTFGQLIEYEGRTQPAPFMRIQLPLNADIHAPVDGVIHYRADFEGFGPSVLLWPKKTFRSDTDYSSLKGLSKPNDLWLVFGHLDATDVRNAINHRYGVVLNKPDPSEETDAFLLGTPGNRDLTVRSSSTLASATRLGQAEGDDLIVAAFRGNPYEGRIDEWVNPLPYLLLIVPEASRPALDDSPPVITDMRIRTGSSPAMSDALVYPVGALEALEPPSVVFGHMAVDVKIQDVAHFGSEALAIYETWYIVSRLTPDGSGGYTRRPVGEGFRAMNSLREGAVFDNAKVYHPDSSAPERSFWYSLRFEPLPWVSRPPMRNLFATDGTGTLDMTGFAAGEYEVHVLVRDAAMASNTYVEERVRFHLDNDPAAVAGARWKLWARAGGEEVEALVDGEVKSIARPGLAMPFQIELHTIDAIPAAAPAVWRYAVRSNGTPGATAELPDPAATTTLDVAAGEVTEVTVWIDQDNDGVHDPTEASRTIAVLTFDPLLAVTGEARPPNPMSLWETIPSGTLVPSTFEARLTSVAPGVPAALAASVVYSWETSGPAGSMTETTAQWVRGPFFVGGEYTVTAVAEIHGARFEEVFEVTSVAAQIEEVHSLCVGLQQRLDVTITPATLPTGATVTVGLEQPAVPATGEIEVVGGAPVVLSGTDQIDVGALNTSTARDNISVVAYHAGVEIARERLSVCDLRVIGPTLTDLDTVLIGLWDMAHEPGGSVRSNFIDHDLRRFFVQVTDWDKAIDPAHPDVITATLSVEDPEPGGDDDATGIRLVETGANTGIFRSYSQLAVSPDYPDGYYPDDDYRADSGHAGRVDDDAFGDRTHHTSIHGVFEARYQSGPGVPPLLVSVPVCRSHTIVTCDRTDSGTPCHANLELIVFQEPFDDIGLGPTAAGANDRIFTFDDVDHDGVHDAGETSEPFIDISTGRTELGTGGTRGPLRDAAEVRELLRFAQVGWAQACIELEEVGFRTPEAPFSGGRHIMVDGRFSGVSHALHGQPGLDELSVLALNNPPAGVPPVADDPLQVFFVSLMNEAPGDTLWAFASVPLARISVPAPLVWLFPNDAAVFMSARSTIEFNTLGHELGHVFTNEGDDLADPILLWRRSAPLPVKRAGVDQNRRLRPADVDTSHEQRTTAADHGNNILVDP